MREEGRGGTLRPCHLPALLTPRVGVTKFRMLLKPWCFELLVLVRTQNSRTTVQPVKNPT